MTPSRPLEMTARIAAMFCADVVKMGVVVE
jgi:hypothetical protein